jgi:hypothetical protein
VGFADSPAVEHHPVARLEVGVRARLDHARAVDAGDHGPLAHHRRAVGDSQPVLEIDRRPADSNHHITIGRIGCKGRIIEFANACDKSGVALFQHNSLKHSDLHWLGCRPVAGLPGLLV